MPVSATKVTTAFQCASGITCLWQVYGRNTIPLEEWMILDMQYIDRWSFWLDIKVLALAIAAVFPGLGLAEFGIKPTAR